VINIVAINIDGPRQTDPPSRIYFSGWADFSGGADFTG
jgi:hypothetical protein